MTDTTQRDSTPRGDAADCPDGPYSDTVDAAELDTRFTAHPSRVSQLKRYDLIRGEARRLAGIIAANTPSGREQSLALTKLEEAVLIANAGIARREG